MSGLVRPCVLANSAARCSSVLRDWNDAPEYSALAPKLREPRSSGVKAVWTAGGRLVKRSRRGAGVSARPSLTHWSPARPPSAPTTLLLLKQTKQHVVINNSERAKQRFVGRSAPQQALHKPSACDHSAVKRRPRSARNKASSERHAIKRRAKHINASSTSVTRFEASTGAFV